MWRMRSTKKQHGDFSRAGRSNLDPFRCSRSWLTSQRSLCYPEPFSRFGIYQLATKASILKLPFNLPRLIILPAGRSSSGKGRKSGIGSEAFAVARL